MEELGNEPVEPEQKPDSCFKRIFSGKASDVKEDHELLAQKMIRELMIYLMFITIVCAIAFGMTSSYSYYYTKVMKDLFIESKDDKIGFKEITSIKQFWDYATEPFTDGLYWDEWYNDEPLGKLNGYIYYENKVLGLPRIRQVRVKVDTCNVADEFKIFIDSCYGDYSSEHEDKAVMEQEQQMKTSKEKIPWTYQDSDKIDGFWHWGELSSYEGGGYIQDLPMDKMEAKKTIEYLKNKRWIQRGTRAVFLTLTVYNANINLFCIIVLTVEFPPTGGAVPSWSFTTVKLIHYDDDFSIFILFCQVLFCLFIAYYFVQEAIEMFFKGRHYFKEFWNFLDLFLVLSSTVCIGFQLYREFVVMGKLPVILADFSKYQDFASLAFWESRSNNAIAITVFLAWVKVFKYISFNKTMTQLATTLSRCAKDLLGFFVMFFIVFLAFTQLGYLLFGNQVEDFSTFMNSFFTLFRIILGDFNFHQLEKANRILGPIFFMLFVFFVFFVLINMFLAIINDTYSEVKSDMTNQTDMYIMSDYLRQSYKRLMARIWQRSGTSRLDNFNQQFATKEKITVMEWEKILIEQGIEDDLVYAVVNKFGLENDHILEPAEQKKILSEMSRVKNIREKEEEQEEYLEAEGKATEYVPSEEFGVVLRRVDRMETTLIGLVSNIDAVLIQISAPKV